MTISAILTDIEGTTSSISFVHEVLFPYASRELPGFVRANYDQPDIAALLTMHDRKQVRQKHRLSV